MLFPSLTVSLPADSILPVRSGLLTVGVEKGGKHAAIGGNAGTPPEKEGLILVRLPISTKEKPVIASGVLAKKLLVSVN
jgi:hypothetical protein